MEHLINKAGRQRMLAERMVKSYVQIVSQVTPKVEVLAPAEDILQRMERVTALYQSLDK